MTLFDTLCSQQNSHHIVSPWCNGPQSGLKARKYPPNQCNITDMFHPTTLPTNVLRICAWNCRGIDSGRAYLLSLLDESDIIVLTEHWLWPSWFSSWAWWPSPWLCCYCCCRQKAKLWVSPHMRMWWSCYHVSYMLRVTWLLQLAKVRAACTDDLTIIGTYMPDTTESTPPEKMPIFSNLEAISHYWLGHDVFAKA